MGPTALKPGPNDFRRIEGIETFMIARLWHGWTSRENAEACEARFLDAVRAFAGADVEVAVVPPKVRKLLARFDQRSMHYEVALSQSFPSLA